MSVPPTILEEALAKSEFTDAIKQAESDLPTDEWRDVPRRYNASRSLREFAVAEKMLAGIDARLKRMTVAELASSLKTLTYPDEVLTKKFSGVEYYVFELGNKKILSEITTRPKAELTVLSTMTNDQVVVFEGEQGPGDTLTEVISNRILKK